MRLVLFLTFFSLFSSDWMEEAIEGLKHAVRSASPQHHTHELTMGFVPDPLIVSGSTLGTRNANTLGEGCSGFISEAPNETILLKSSSLFLRFFAVSSTNLSLVVRKPDGTYLCNADRFGEHPAVQGHLEPGIYEVFLATPTRAVIADYRLRITEMRSVRPYVSSDEHARSLIAELDLGLTDTQGTQGDKVLERGFLPDPAKLEGRTSGRVDISTLDVDCQGFVSKNPEHVIAIKDAMQHMEIRLESDALLHLMSIDEEGNINCSSMRGPIPTLRFSNLKPGTWRLWISTRRPGDVNEYQVSITEHPSD